MQDTLSYSEFMEWADYFARFPTHADRSEIQLAKQSQIIASQNAKTPANFYDYTITFKKENEEETSKDNGSYIDKKGRRILSSKNIDKILDEKFAS